MKVEKRNFVLSIILSISLQNKLSLSVLTLCSTQRMQDTGSCTFQNWRTFVGIINILAELNMMHGKSLQYVLCGAKCVYCFRSRLYIMFLGCNLSSKTRDCFISLISNFETYRCASRCQDKPIPVLLLMPPYHLVKLMVKDLCLRRRILNTFHCCENIDTQHRQPSCIH